MAGSLNGLTIGKRCRQGFFNQNGNARLYQRDGMGSMQGRRGRDDRKINAMLDKFLY